MNKKIRILNVLTVLREGGMESVVNNIYKGLSGKDDFEFYVCALVDQGNNFVIEKFKTLGANVFTLGVINKNLKLQDYLVLFLKTFTLARYIARNKIDVVHSHDFFAPAITRMAVILSIVLFWHKPRKNIVTLHIISFWLNKWHHRINRMLSVFTDKIICVSKSVYEFSLEKDKIRKDKYVVYYNSINDEDFKPRPDCNEQYRKTFGCGESDFILGNVGTLSIRKGHKYLIEAFLESLEEHPELRLLIFGGTRGHEEAVKNEIFDLINKNGIKDKVKFVSPREDIRFIYNMFNIFVMSSITEGLSLAAIEAMLTERICIFSDIGPFKELVTSGENGLLFENGNSKDLALKLQDVINNFDKYSYMGKNARKTILEKFSFEKMINNYYELYKN